MPHVLKSPFKEKADEFLERMYDGVDKSQPLVSGVVLDSLMAKYGHNNAVDVGNGMMSVCDKTGDQLLNYAEAKECADRFLDGETHD